MQQPSAGPSQVLTDATGGGYCQPRQAVDAANPQGISTLYRGHIVGSNVLTGTTTQTLMARATASGRGRQLPTIGERQEMGDG
jgi:hypothetical protein